jgi:hypothetical protein
VTKLRVGGVARIWEGDDVWERSGVANVCWESTASQPEFACYCLQAIGKVCFIILPKHSSLQVKWDLPTVRDGAEKELTDLFQQVFGDVIHATEPAKLDLTSKIRKDQTYASRSDSTSSGER